MTPAPLTESVVPGVVEPMPRRPEESTTIRPVPAEFCISNMFTDWEAAARKIPAVAVDDVAKTERVAGEIGVEFPIET